MTVNLRQEDGTEVPLTTAQKKDLRDTIGAMPKPVHLTEAEIAAPSVEVLADTDAIYVLDEVPHTRYRSDGTELLAQEDVGHTHTLSDVAGLADTLTQLGNDNAAALLAAQAAQESASDAEDAAAAAQADVAGATAAAAAATAAADDAATAAAAAQSTATTAAAAAAAAQSDADGLVASVAAATSAAGAASTAANAAQASADALAAVGVLYVGAQGAAAQGRQLVAGSRVSLTVGDPGEDVVVQTRTDVAAQFTAGQAVAFIDLTFGDPVGWDALLSNNARLTLAANTTLGKPSNLMGGQRLQLKVKQDGTGGYSLAYDPAFKWPGGTPPVLPTAADATGLLEFTYDDVDDVLDGRAHLAYA